MFEIKNMDFIGNEAFEKLLDTFFSGVPMERVFDGGVPGIRVYVPRREDPRLSRRNSDWEITRDVPKFKVLKDPPPMTEPIKPRFKDEKPVVEPRKEPKSILEMLEDGDERLEKLLGKIVDERLAKRADTEDEVPVEKKNPFVYIANRLTFLIQTKFPLVFDTSIIKTDEKSMTIAVNEGKTIPKLNHIDELGFITSEVNRDEDIQKELEEYLDDTEYGKVYCFPSFTEDEGGDGESVYAVKFVLYPKK